MKITEILIVEGLEKEIEYYDVEKQHPKKISYYKNGKRHRDNGPAVVIFSESGTTTAQIDYKDGEMIGMSLETSFTAYSDIGEAIKKREI